ncbi:hypothetical protein [Mycoplasma leonicaptivi]|nr:hypothetical protein [Mycoplasma leonicaptivi]
MHKGWKRDKLNKQDMVEFINKKVDLLDLEKKMDCQGQTKKILDFLAKI